MSRRPGLSFRFVDASTMSKHIQTAAGTPSKRSDQPAFTRNLAREMPRADAEFSADIIEVIIDVGFAALDDHGNLPGRFAGLAPLQEFLFTFGESNYLGWVALRGMERALVWRRTSRSGGAVVHDWNSHSSSLMAWGRRNLPTT